MKTYKLHTDKLEVVDLDNVIVEEVETIEVPARTDTNVRRVTLGQIKQEIAQIDTQIAELTARKTELEASKVKVATEAAKVTSAVK